MLAVLRVNMGAHYFIWVAKSNRAIFNGNIKQVPLKASCTARDTPTGTTSPKHYRLVGDQSSVCRHLVDIARICASNTYKVQTTFMKILHI